MPSTIQSPEDWPMVLYHGDTWPAYAFLLISEIGGAFAGFSLKMQVRTLDGVTVVKTLVIGNGFTVVGNLVTFTTSVDIDPGEYVYDLQVTLSTGKIYTQYAGFISVIKDVTV